MTGCQTYDGSVRIVNYDADAIDLSNQMTKINGDLVVAHNTRVTSLRIAQLQQVGGDVSMYDNPILQYVNLASLT